MKKIKSFYYEIVISKIYMLEKYKREFDEGNIYNGIWGTLQTFVVYTVISFIFILIRIFGTLQNPLATGIGVVILNSKELFDLKCFKNNSSYWESL